MVTKLNGDQTRQLVEALVEAFPDYDELQMMVRFGMNENLEAKAGRGRTEVVSFNLIKWAESRGRLDELIVASRNQNPGNPALLALAEGLQLAAAPPPPGELQRILHKAAGFQDVVQWRDGMVSSELAICRVEHEDNGVKSGIGTGFLVGPDLVMTNWHVMEDVITRRYDARDMVLRFDYKAGPDGITIKPGQEYRLAADWNLDSSKPAELDYSLLRVEGKPGSTSVGGQMGAPPRGWLIPRDHLFENNEPLLILQHPKAEPLKLAFGSALSVDPTLKRLLHDVNTEPGSSGSPCFDSSWNVVALHHFGADTANRAIPMGLILQQLQTRGIRSEDKRGFVYSGPNITPPSPPAPEEPVDTAEATDGATGGDQRAAIRQPPSPPVTSVRRNRPPSQPD